MDGLINTAIMRNPLNWAIVTVMAAFALIAAAVLFPTIFVSPSSSQP